MSLVALMALAGVGAAHDGTDAGPGQYLRPGTVERVSVASDGTEANGHSYTAPSIVDISGTGRFVTFLSDATNLVPGDTNALDDAFIHDRATGITERVSVASDGTQANGDAYFRAHVSDDGRFVVFATDASNLVPDDTNGVVDVFVRDRALGTTERVSVSDDGAQANGDYSDLGDISADGRYVAFVSPATNLVSGDTNGVADIFVHDLQTGGKLRIEAPIGPESDMEPTQAYHPRISADGSRVSFVGAGVVYLWDRTTDTTKRVSPLEAEICSSEFPSISADGMVVAFGSTCSTFVPGDKNKVDLLVTNPGFAITAKDTFAYDDRTGIVERVAVSSDGREAHGWTNSAMYAGISGDGRFVSFTALYAPTFNDYETSATWEAYLHDRVLGTTEVISIATDGSFPGGVEPVMSDDGRYVAFMGFYSFMPDDTNDAWDVFVRDRGPITGVGGTEAVSEDDTIVVSGRATFSGAVIAHEEDATGEVIAIGDVLGADIEGASVTYRKERGDLLLKTQLTSLPGPVIGGAPGVEYSWRIVVQGTAYEVQATRFAGNADTPENSTFSLLKCDPECDTISALRGGIGTAGVDVRVTVPLALIGATEGDLVGGLVAATTLRNPLGSSVVLDDVALDDAEIPVSSVLVGIDASGDQVIAALSEGQFVATLDPSSLPVEGSSVWAKACLGSVCGQETIQVS